MPETTKTFRGYITAYALTKGVMELEMTTSNVVDGSVVWYFPGSTYPWYSHGEGKEWHRTKEGAVARANTMRLARIASLKKQIAKLEKMTFV